MGFDTNLNIALANAKAESISLLMRERGVSASQAPQLMLQVSDCRVTQIVDGKKGVHCMIPIGNSHAFNEHRPQQDTNHELVTVSNHSDLNEAMNLASLAMIAKLQTDKGLSRLDAYSIASVAMDCRLDINASPVGVHCLVPKSLWVN